MKSTDNPDASKSHSINSWEIKKGASRARMRKCDEKIARFYVTRTGCLICKVQRKVKNEISVEKSSAMSG